VNVGSGPASLRIGGRMFDWGSRTYLMGIINVTPDSFSGDGLAPDGIAAAVEQAMRMVGEGVDILDIGGESTRPGHDAVGVEEERRRVVPVITAIRAALPDVPLSVDTTKVEVAVAAVGAGADLLNDVAGVSGDGSLAALAGRSGLPYVLMHDRSVGDAAGSMVAERVAQDLVEARARAVAQGCDAASIILDPGIGFGKTAEQNLLLLRDLAVVRALGSPLLLGASRKSTIGRVLELPVDDRLEGTLATTALGIASGADMVRVHDVRANGRVARMTDAIVRGWRPPDQETHA
jgi:dihydropteroate synthase